MYCQMRCQSQHDTSNPWRKTLAHNHAIRVAYQLFAQYLIGGDTMNKILNHTFFHGGFPFLPGSLRDTSLMLLYKLKALTRSTYYLHREANGGNIASFKYEVGHLIHA